jgi:hypothetical protein
MTLKRTICGLAALILLTCAFADARAGITVDNSAFGVSPAHFNGFEGVPNDGTYLTSPGPPFSYTEDGIVVQQVNSAADIWVTFFHPGGDFGWYPSGGDTGFTAHLILNFI